MNAPLSLFLTRFSATLPVRVLESLPYQTTATLSIEDLEVQRETDSIDAELGDERSKAEADALRVAHKAAIDDAVETARLEWSANEGATLAAGFSEGLSGLRDRLEDRLATILRPFVSGALLARSKQELNDALDRLLADPARPSLSIRGPEDLLGQLKERHGSAGIEWVVTETCDVVVLADAARIETCLGTALTRLETPEA